MPDMPFFDHFRSQFDRPDRIESLRAGLIGEGLTFEGPFGPRTLIYADYVASGRALRQVEDTILHEVLPLYANSHTEGSHCSAFITRLRRDARAVIARHCGADDSHATIFTGSGATAGLNRLVHLLGVTDDVAAGRAPLILIGPYEHHSNILPWRESGAEMVEINEDPQRGGPCLAHLEQLLRSAAGRPVIGAFSAASNISGILTDTVAVTRLLRQYGARAVWDYAGGAPYLAMDMAVGSDHEKDAIVFSPHKFIGGPGASGILIVRKSALRRDVPVWPGGGTVSYVSPWGQDYAASPEAREEAGTPNVVGDIRAALVVLVKEAMGQDWLDARHTALRARAAVAFAGLPGFRYAGDRGTAPALPFFACWLESACGLPSRHGAMTRALSDHFGIQARSGCACAGPYGHRLFGIDRAGSEAIRARIRAGDDDARPGFTRFNLSALMSDEKVDTILAAISELARNPDAYLRTPANSGIPPEGTPRQTG
ncbi:aminotransferase class V-fold PLP-dependent enzyme [Paracoccus sp. (in: a-proteobacteria)]|uniref:aminotransferase class V-fold PLP-dependent enzyme n=1 Tax=Paracoccus sp. TaxID=267 RepID=UPI003A856ED0